MFTPVKVDMITYEPERVGGKGIFLLLFWIAYSSVNENYIKEWIKQYSKYRLVN